MEGPCQGAQPRPRHRSSIILGDNLCDVFVSAGISTSIKRLAVLLSLTLASSCGSRPESREIKSDDGDLTFRTADAELAKGYTAFIAVRELVNGKALVLDGGDQTVELVDFATGDTAQVGRKGNGPGEYQSPFQLLPLPDGSTLIPDPSNNRYLKITSTGAIAGEITAPKLSQKQFPISPFGIDTKGRLYFDAPLILTSSADAAKISVDSTPIVRWDLMSPTVDTVGWKPSAGFGVWLEAAGSGTDGVARVITAGPRGKHKIFGPVDVWVVGGEGMVGHLTSEPYRMTWHSAGSPPKVGPIEQVTPVPVTQADKDAYRRALEAEYGAQNIRGTLEFAEHRPAFDPHGVQVSPEGDVWVQRTSAEGDTVSRYDIFGMGGAIVKHATFPARTRIVGFGRGTIYAVRIDDDDLQHLQRFKR